jgi:hypothetical protein
MKKAQFDAEDIIALMLWVSMVVVFLIIFQLGGCNSRFSEATIEAETENTIQATRTLLNYLNNKVEYNNQDITIGELISRLYTIEDASEKDDIQRSLNQKTREILGENTCWSIVVLANPRTEVVSSKCQEKEPLEELVSRVLVSTKIPKAEDQVEVEYRLYVFRQKEIAGKH